jgi:hypothetical protein
MMTASSRIAMMPRDSQAMTSAGAGGGAAAPPPAHRPPSRAVAVAALLFLVLAVASVLYVFLFIGAEMRLLKQAEPFRAGANVPAKGKLVFLTGTISRKNPALIDDLVVACEEEKDPDSRSWNPKREIYEPLIIDHEATEVWVTLRQPCPRGDYAVIPNPETRSLRWVGFRPGQTVTIVGRVERPEPLSVRAEHYFGGSVDDYRGYLTRARWYVVPFAVACLLASALCWWGGRRRAYARDRVTRDRVA